MSKSGQPNTKADEGGQRADTGLQQDDKKHKGASKDPSQHGSAKGTAGKAGSGKKKSSGKQTR